MSPPPDYSPTAGFPAAPAGAAGSGCPRPPRGSPCSGAS